MRKGAYVLIFLVWAFITIITPKLVQWSFVAADEAHAHQAQATTQSLIQGKSSEEEGTVKHYRRMLVMIDGINIRKVPLGEPALPPHSEVRPPVASPAQPSDQEAERWSIDF